MIDREHSLPSEVRDAVAVLPRPPLNTNRVHPGDEPVHDWYRFVLSFPPHLVRHYVERFGLDSRSTVLDPFCGTGTTLVECKKLGVPSIGVESNPIAAFASAVKTDWHVDPIRLKNHAHRIADRTRTVLQAEGISDDAEYPLFDAQTARTGQLRELSKDSLKLLLKGSISPIPLHKVLVLRDYIDRARTKEYTAHERLALAKTAVECSNLKFGPEVGVGARRTDAPVVDRWQQSVGRMARDLSENADRADVRTVVHEADARDLDQLEGCPGIDAVFTSPPYPNEKDYTRTTRLESVLLGFMESREDLRGLKRSLLSSNTRCTYRSDDDDKYVADVKQVQDVAEAVEQRRIELNKDSGFERLYARVTRLYFGGMARHLQSLRPLLSPGARLAYVVGDQASYLRVMIRTGHLLAVIAEKQGYEVEAVDLFRTRMATATRAQLREEVVVLRWPGRRIA